MAESRKKRAPFFATSAGLVTGAMLLFIVSAALAVLAMFSQTPPGEAAAAVDLDAQRQQVALLYVAYLPSVLAAMGGIALLIIGSVRWAMFGRDAVGVPIGDAVETELLESINTRMLLSDTAKRIAYRTEDIALLTQTIRNDVASGQHNAALVLVNELANTYGQKVEAENFRDQILASRRSQLDQAVNAALGVLKEKVAAHDFTAAQEEAQKIQRLYPDSPLAKAAPQRVNAAREQYKRDMERQFLEAAERDDLDAAMKLIREMDQYLSEEEAAPYLETARGVIGKARDNLGVQFKLAVHDKEWVTGINVGQQIIRQFPNSKMADEVRGMIDMLREHAAGQQAATPTPTPAPGS